MYEVMSDESGGIHFFPLDDDYRNAVVGAPRPRPRRPRPRRPRRPIVVQQGPHYAPMPIQYPPVTYPPPMPPVPVQYPATPYPYPMPPGYRPPGAGMDMQTGLKALGALLPGLGKLLAAFRGAPERPALSGQPDKDLDGIMDYIAETFDRDRTGAQVSGVLATTGAVLEILAEL